MRYPILWERTLRPDGRVDWSWADERLARLRTLGITPIVGFLHHGSGPACTSLIDPGLPRRLADFARAFAERYPWVDHFTPVNEPLTTARFSCLYGHWYPHVSDSRMFFHALLNQCEAVKSCMEAIRSVTPAAKLVQTEDLGLTLATAPLAYQAEFENERRWLTWDLLSGFVRPDTAMWRYASFLGVPRVRLETFLEQPCPPDVIGANYYVTSVRFLDHRIRRYPPHTHGGNGTHRYADIEAVRACAHYPRPIEVLREAAERYSSPLAITEVQLASHDPGHQIRWFSRFWNAATELNAAGHRVLAVTAWSLLGAFDWHCLATREEGCYEPGAFDVRSGIPVRTELGDFLAALARTGKPEHPCLSEPGWWEDPSRLHYPSYRGRHGRVRRRQPALSRFALPTAANDDTAEGGRV